MEFLLPPRIINEKNDVRTVGFELEFSGIELNDVAQLIANLFNGTPRQVNKFLHYVNGTQYGDFKIELDTALLKDEKYLEFLDKIGIDIRNHPIQHSIEDALAKISSLIVPYEIAAPPLPINNLDPIERIREQLQKNQAAGTKDSFIYAFGLHINPEVPATDLKTILDYFRSFLLLYRWIFEESGIDLARRISPFINEFPSEYVKIVLSPDYAPDSPRFAADYLDYNPTRNRTLDLLPLIGYINRDLFPEIREMNVSTRPTFHYRLPNCLIDDPSWTIAREWKYWVIIERLANKPEKMNELIENYFELMESNKLDFKNQWNIKVKKWLQKNGFLNR